MIKKLLLVSIVSIFLTGCPYEDNESQCKKVMQCESESEMVCDKRENGCGEDCHYYVIEHCYEVCEE